MPQVNLLVIRSNDIDSSAALYGSLGFEFVKHSHGTGPQHYACELEHMVFEIYPVQKTGDVSIGARIGFKVVSVDDSILLMAQKGAKVLSAPKDSPWGRRAVLTDLDGHRIELTEASATT